MVRKIASGKVVISRSRIIRAVASSSAIETGESTQVIEQRLRFGTRRFAKLTLASKA
jgi:hypothetical protein